MLDSQFNEETLPPLDQPVAAYRVRRSPFDYKLFSCYAVDFLDNNLYPIVVDAKFDVASNYANEYNKELEEIEQNITDSVYAAANSFVTTQLLSALFLNQETFEDPIDNP